MTLSLSDSLTHMFKKYSIIGLLVIITGFSIVILLSRLPNVEASDTPPPEVLRHIEGIKANQETIAETREAHEAFLRAKSDNTYRMGAINSFGWSIDWATLNPVRFK